MSPNQAADRSNFCKSFVTARDGRLNPERSFNKKFSLWEKGKADWCFVCYGGDVRDVAAADFREMLLAAAQSDSLTVAFLFKNDGETPANPSAELFECLSVLFPDGCEPSCNCWWEDNLGIAIIFLFDPVFSAVPEHVAQMRYTAFVLAHTEIIVEADRVSDAETQDAPEGWCPVFFN